MKTQTIAAATMLLLTAGLASLAFVPSAAAHVCADTPQQPSCGGCAQTTNFAVHYHTRNGVFQCASVGEVGIDGLSAMSVSEVVAGLGF
ncbi:MAG: hypothetical protein WC876_02370 [Candidatus Thermoplasmatota archaeon]